VGFFKFCVKLLLAKIHTTFMAYTKALSDTNGFSITILQRRFPKVLCKALVRFYKALRQPLRKEDPKDPNPLGYEQGPGEPPPHARAQSRSERLALKCLDPMGGTIRLPVVARPVTSGGLRLLWPIDDC
jgi:hypothetical protein